MTENNFKRQFLFQSSLSWAVSRRIRARQRECLSNYENLVIILVNKDTMLAEIARKQVF